MILVFLFVFMILDLLFITLILSTLKIEINKLVITNHTNMETGKYLIKISLNVFKKVKWISIKIDKKRFEKIYSKIDIKKIKSKAILNNIKKIDFKEIKPNIDHFNFKANLGFKDNAIFTSSIVFVLSLLISAVLPQITRKINEKDFKYYVVPVYNKNVYYMELNCIFSLKLVHIINIVYMYLKERKK